MATVVPMNIRTAVAGLTVILVSGTSSYAQTDVPDYIQKETIRLYSGVDFTAGGWFREQAKDKILHPVSAYDPRTPHALQAFIGFNDVSSSLKWNLPPGVVVVLYEHWQNNPPRRQFVIWGRGEHRRLRESSFDDMASSWAWFYVGGTPNAPKDICDGFAERPLTATEVTAKVLDDSIQLFDGKPGTRMEPITEVTAKTEGNLQPIGDLAGKVTSLRWKLRPGVIVVFYQGRQGGKRQFAIWGNGEVHRLNTQLNNKVTVWKWIDVASLKTTSVDSSPPAGPVLGGRPAGPYEARSLARKPAERGVDQTP